MSFAHVEVGKNLKNVVDKYKKQATPNIAKSGEAHNWKGISPFQPSLSLIVILKFLEYLKINNRQLCINFVLLSSFL